MPNRPRLTHLGSWSTLTLLLTLLVALCVNYLDAPLAYFIRDHFYVNLHWSRLTSNLPDLLLQLVLLVTCASLALYRIRASRGLLDPVTRLAQMLAWAAPASYLVKSVLKFVFGRVNTRVWLQQPDLYGFHWLERREGCEGFPSGHMLVLAALLAALWRFFPRCRPWCLLLGVLLGVALVVTDYHFLSDVIAGAYLGILVEALAFWWLAREPLRPEITAP
jgi:membrane-associated phospholipid phosphatase